MRGLQQFYHLQSRMHDARPRAKTANESDKLIIHDVIYY